MRRAVKAGSNIDVAKRPAAQLQPRLAWRQIIEGRLHLIGQVIIHQETKRLL